MLDSLPKHCAYAERTLEYNGGYDWVTLRNRLHKIEKNEENDETKLLITLHMDEVPQISSDYADCLINQLDDGRRNIIQFTKDKK